ncbi:MAG TPA: hypothetical protein VH439_03595 [Gemmatimonadales bacterium]|jgi:hypothetical protein
MHRGLRRLVSIAVGVWFVVALTGQPAIARCPIHDAPPANQGTHRHAHHSGAQGHLCHCIHHCCGAATATTVSGAGGQFQPAPVRTTFVAAAESGVIPSLFDYTVVYTTGPPSALTA